jgi:hypothetical protein
MKPDLGCLAKHGREMRLRSAEKPANRLTLANAGPAAYVGDASAVNDDLANQQNTQLAGLPSDRAGLPIGRTAIGDGGLILEAGNLSAGVESFEGIGGAGRHARRE